jgi:hypothetical protein
MQKTVVIVLAIALAGAGLLSLSDAGAKKHRKKKKRVPATVVLNQTPVQSGTVAVARRCRRNRYVEIHRASNGALVATANTNATGAFGAAGGYSGSAYAVVKRAGRKKTKCLAARSAVVNLGVADLQVAQTAVPSAQTGANAAGYDITIANLGPDTAQDIVLTDTPKGGGFSLDAGRTSAGCTLAGAVVTCKVGTLTPGQTTSRRIVFTCDPGTMSLLNDASASSSARDPNAANSTSADIASDPC